MSNISAKAQEHFNSGWLCAESVLKAIAEEYGVKKVCFPRVATGFCSGLSRTCGMCGALSGAVMGIGLVLGRDDPCEELSPCYEASQKVITRFEERFGSCNCQELIGLDLGKVVDQQRFKDENKKAVCTEFCGVVAALAHEVLQEELKKRSMDAA